MTLFSRVRFGRALFFMAVVFALLLSLVYKSSWLALFKNENLKHAELDTSTASEIKNAAKEDSKYKKYSTIDSKSAVLLASTTTFSGFSSAEINEVENWFASHGNFMFESEEDQYSSYNMETLKQLAETGDLRALHELTKLYLNAENSVAYGFDAAVPLFWKAATYGSTQALIELGIVTDANYRFGSHTAAEKQSANLEVLSLYEAAAKRGDKWGVLVYGKSMMSSSNIALTDADKEVINKRSQEIINQLQQRRYDIGLGQFDNSAPDTVKRFFDQLESRPN